MTKWWNLVDTTGLNPVAARRAGSIPALVTMDEELRNIMIMERLEALEVDMLEAEDAGLSEDELHLKFQLSVDRIMIETKMKG